MCLSSLIEKIFIIFFIVLFPSSLFRSISYLIWREEITVPLQFPFLQFIFPPAVRIKGIPLGLSDATVLWTLHAEARFRTDSNCHDKTVQPGYDCGLNKCPGAGTVVWCA